MHILLPFLILILKSVQFSGILNLLHLTTQTWLSQFDSPRNNIKKQKKLAMNRSNSICCSEDLSLIFQASG
jgi:hypothetical protein